MKQPLIATIILSLTAALSLALILPQYRYLMAVRTAVASRKIIVEKAQSAEAVVDLATSKAEGELKPLLNRLTAAVPFERDLDYLIVAMSAIVRDAGLTIKDIKFAGSATSTARASTAGGTEVFTEGGPAYGTTVISLTLVGEYNSFFRFLTNLESSARLFDVTRLLINSDRDGLLTYSVDITTYTLNPRPLQTPEETAPPAVPTNGNPKQ